MTAARIDSFRARYLFPIDRPPIRDGWITISNGRIVTVGDEPAGNRHDLGDVAILPGLINAHTHLEFSLLERPLGEAGMSFPHWIREVIRYRRGMIEQFPGSDWRQQAICRGLAESIRGGTTTLGEIATLPWQAGERRDETLQGVRFLELLGLAPARHDELLSAAHDFLATGHAGTPNLRCGLSPHAPYTVSPRLVASVAALSAREGIPVAMHLAETRDELELLRAGSGPFRELLEEVGAWSPDAIPPGSTPLDYLQPLSRADRSLVIHGNYLIEEEIEFAGRQCDRMSIVYCPRTHAYFGHKRYPLKEMIAAGVHVALGTDSRASNPDLSMLNELRFAAAQHPDVAPATILRLATTNAAQALGMSETLGSLTPGKQADLIVIPVSIDQRSDPHELLCDTDCGVQRVIRYGQPVVP